MEQNNSAKLLGYFLDSLYNKNGPRPRRPQIQILSQIFSDFLQGSRPRHPNTILTGFGPDRSIGMEQPAQRPPIGWSNTTLKSIGPQRATNKIFPKENGGKPEKNKFGAYGVWGVIFTVNTIKRIAQKLCMMILLHFRLVSSRIHFEKTRKPFMFMVFGPGGRDHDS